MLQVYALGFRVRELVGVWHITSNSRLHGKPRDFYFGPYEVKGLENLGSPLPTPSPKRALLRL